MDKELYDRNVGDVYQDEKATKAIAKGTIAVDVQKLKIMHRRPMDCIGK